MDTTISQNTTPTSGMAADSVSLLKRLKNVRLGEILTESGYITEQQLGEALKRQKESPVRRLLGDILVEMGALTERQKLEALGRRLQIPLVHIDAYSTDLDAVAKIPRAIAEKHNLIALRITGGQLTVAVNDPLNFFAIEDIRQLVRMDIGLCLAESKEIHDVTEYCYSELNTRHTAAVAGQTAEEEVVAEDYAAETTDDAPVVKLLNSLLVKGYNINASDIHIEPFENRVSIRMRVDGVINDYMTIPKNIHQSIVARIKIISSLDIAEKRVPQDGHMRLTLGGIDMNLRVSLVPTVFGEKAVLRFLTTNTKVDYAGRFGMNEESYTKVMQALKSPHGIIYITGPTGSGKTTTLYMILDYLASRKVNIATIEDPVERNIERVNQMQVNNTAGMTFDIGLRAILRQDPDIIMLGETRDAETASISIRAAITGHLVLSTLHTNDAVSSIVRLSDMGVPSYLISSSLVCVVAQRLVRKICPECGEEYTPSDEEQKILGVPVEKLRRGRGCPACSNTGYKGRLAVHEIVLIDKTIRNMISKKADSDAIFEYATKVQGMKTLRQQATDLVLAGLTTPEELLRTAYYEGE